VKLDASGIIKRQKCFGGSGYEEATSVFQTSCGDYIIAGQTMSNDGNVLDNQSVGACVWWIVGVDVAVNFHW